MKRWLIAVAFILGAASLVLVWRLYVTHADALAWQQHASPGELSWAHATLETECAACHTSIAGPTDTQCMSCHANNTALLQRQPTAFHAGIGQCADCHIEHRGRDANLRQMNHTILARVGLRQMKGTTGHVDAKAPRELLQWVKAHPLGSSPITSHPLITPLEATLDCKSCHATKDRHSGLFGSECASCHATTQWILAQFQHPSTNSRECAQCHQAPPSHRMMHFEMVSKRIARQEDAQVAQCCGRAQVNQCYRCHQTTSWNDIKGVGWYKHH